MPYELKDRLVIGIASSALFDLRTSEAVFDEQGEQAYRDFQEQHLDEPLAPGVAFPFIRRLLSLNHLETDVPGPFVEVIVLSRNDPDTGLRVMRSVDHYELPITRAIFMAGKSPYKFMRPLHMSLFLSAQDRDVEDAVRRRLSAGRVLHSDLADDPEDQDDLRIAFDFDGVLADDASEQAFAQGDLAKFQEHEQRNIQTPHGHGPLNDFLAKINVLQRAEEKLRLINPGYQVRLHVSIVTAQRPRPRACDQLAEWGLTVNDAFFLGGIEKGPIIETLGPHIFFDDQLAHLKPAAGRVPSVHIPFGIRNVAR